MKLTKIGPPQTATAIQYINYAIGSKGFCMTVPSVKKLTARVILVATSVKTCSSLTYVYTGNKVWIEGISGTA